MPVDPESLYARGLISDDRMDQLRQSMTHQPEGANPAGPYLDRVKQIGGRGLGFATGGLKGAGVDVLPDWMNRVGGVFQNPDNQAAMGAIGPSGAYLRGRPFADLDMNKVKDMLKGGKSLSEIGKEFNVSKVTVKRKLDALGLKSEAEPGRKVKESFGEDSVTSEWVTLPDGTLGRRTGAEDLR
jgi:Helix-turn-helix domain of resolvase